MDKKQNRTIELYKEIGARSRLIKIFLGDFLINAQHVLYATEQDKLMYKDIKHIELLISTMEDRMFQDHPELGHDYTNVFYGGMDNYPNDVGDEIKEKMKAIVTDLIIRKE